MGIEVSSSRISLCLQPSRKERKPCSSWLWEKNISTLPGKLSGKGLVSRHRSSFHPVISTGGATVTTNEKGYAHGKMCVSQAGHNSCSSDAMPEARGMKHWWKWLFPAAHHVCQREEGKKAGIISQERSCWFWSVCIFRTRLYVWGFKCEPLSGSYPWLYCFTTSQNILLNYPWGQREWTSSPVGGGVAWSLHSRSEKFLCDVTWP